LPIFSPLMLELEPDMELLPGNVRSPSGLVLT